MRRFLTRCGVIIFFLIWGCGLPDSAFVNVNSLNKPELKVYNKEDVLYLEITGYYPVAEFPNFSGYNVYVGDNNDPNKVINRVMYISDDNNLPSFQRSASDSVVTVSIPLSEIRFRYSRHAKKDDIPNSYSTDDFLSKSLVKQERYYFVVEAVEANRTGIRTEAVPIVFIEYQTNVTWNYSNTISENINLFTNMSVSEDFFIFPKIGGYTFSILTAGPKPSVYQPIPENNYNEKSYMPFVNTIYFFKVAIQKDAITQYEYLSVWVREKNPAGLIINYGYKSLVKIPDFDNDVNRILNN